MKDQLISFEIAKLAKEKGFDEWCANGYNIHSTVDKHKLQEIKNKNSGVMYISAPTQSLLQKWLREKHKIHVSAFPVVPERWYCSLSYITNDGLKTVIGAPYNPKNALGSYEEALEKALLEALTLVKI